MIRRYWESKITEFQIMAETELFMLILISKMYFLSKRLGWIRTVATGRWGSRRGGIGGGRGKRQREEMDREEQREQKVAFWAGAPNIFQNTLRTFPKFVAKPIFFRNFLWKNLGNKVLKNLKLRGCRTKGCRLFELRSKCSILNDTGQCEMCLKKARVRIQILS